jgi:UDP-glucose 4-epimerase
VRGVPLLVHGDGGQSRDFIFVADVVSALVSAMKALDAKSEPKADIANTCTGKAVTIKDLAQIVMMIVGRSVKIESGSYREGDIRRSVGDPAYADKRLSFKARTALADGLASTYRAISSANNE